MNKTTLAVLTISSVAALASIAGAVPFGPENLPPGLSRHDGVPPGLSSQNGLPAGLSSQGGNLPLVTPIVNTPVVGVPEGGTSLLMLGAGLFMLAFLHRRWQQSSN